MRKSLKALFIIALLLLLLPLWYTLVGTQLWANLPFILTPIADYPIVGGWLEEALFWLSFAFMLFIILLILVIIFYPKAQNQLEIEQADGSLKIQKKAIESYVLASIKEEPFIADPRVKVKIVKDKVKVEVRGKMRKVFKTAEKQEQLAAKIKTDIGQLIGAKGVVVTNVSFKDYRKEARAANVARVQ